MSLSSKINLRSVEERAEMQKGAIIFGNGPKK